VRRLIETSAKIIQRIYFRRQNIVARCFDFIGNFFAL